MRKCTCFLQNGRPAPILPERPLTPDEHRQRGNPNLDSDTNTLSSRDTGNVEDDGVCSIPDNMSEDDVPHHSATIPVAQPPNHNGYHYNDQDYEPRKLSEGLPNVFPQIAYPNGGLFDQAQQMQLQLLSQIAAQNGLAFPTQVMPRGHLQSCALNLPSLHTGQQQPRALHPGFLQNLIYRGTAGNSTHYTSHLGQASTNRVPNTNGLEIRDEYVLQKSKLTSAKNRSPPKEKHTRLKPTHGSENQSNMSSISQMELNGVDHREETNVENERELFEQGEKKVDDWENEGEEEDVLNEESSEV